MAPLSQEMIDTLYQPVGTLVITWALTEQTLDSCIAVIYQTTAGRHLEPELPRSVKRKARFLKLSHRLVDILKPLAAEGLPLFSEANRLAQIRHTVVHGVISEYDSRTKKVTFTMLDATGTKHRTEDRKLSVDEIVRAGAEIHSLASKLTKFASQLFETCIPDHKPKDGKTR